MDSISSETHAYTQQWLSDGLMHCKCKNCQVFRALKSQAKRDPTTWSLLLRLTLSFTAEKKHRSRLTRGTFSRIQLFEKTGSSRMTQWFMFLLSMCQGMLTGITVWHVPRDKCNKSQRRAGILKHPAVSTAKRAFICGQHAQMQSGVWRCVVGQCFRCKR